ncbi:MAG: DUF4040 domain-containing protein [Cyanobacteria bacterium J06635_10]
MSENLDIYLYIIIALLPLTSCLVVLQVNPYHALALRGILGAIAALVYAVLGAADVALTEALMGTLLAITLYAVAVRSSLVLRVGILEDGTQLEGEIDFQEVIAEFREILNKRHMRLEILPYTDKQALQRALMEKEIHATLSRSSVMQVGERESTNAQVYDDFGIRRSSYLAITRIRRIYDIMIAELVSGQTTVNYVNVADANAAKLKEKHL